MNPPATGTHRFHPKALAYGVAAGPLLWTLHLWVSYTLASLGCSAGGLDASLARWLILGLTVVLVALVGLAGWLAYGNWRALSRPGSAAALKFERTVALAGVLLSGLFGFMLLFAAVPALVVRPCY